MGLLIFEFILSAVAICVAGSLLTKFADKIAAETGLGHMMIGGVVLASATALPELLVDFEAVEMDLPDLAVGDLLGSSIFNLLMLSILDFTFPSTFRRTSFSPVFSHHSLAAVLSIFLTAIVGMGILSRITTSILGISIFAWFLPLIYFFGLKLIYTERKLQAAKNGERMRISLVDLLRRRSLTLSLFGCVLSTVIILISAPSLVRTTDLITQYSGLGYSFIGTTLLAMITSLPEFVSTLTAFRMGAPDLALGLIIGSNTFNMLLFLPLDLMYPKVLFSSVQNIHAITAFCIIAIMSIAVMGQLYHAKKRPRFSAPSSEMVVVLIMLFLFFLYKINLEQLG